jgi:CheY-like chemotaxis protein
MAYRSLKARFRLSLVFAVLPIYWNERRTNRPNDDNHRKEDLMSQTILIVDDDPDIGNLLAHILEDEGYTAVYVDTGEAALHYLSTTPPDLILLDYLMPGMDGPTFVRKAEQQDLRDSIPLILVTASDAVQERAQLARTDGFLGKPFELLDVLDTVVRFLPPLAASH